MMLRINYLMTGLIATAIVLSACSIVQNQTEALPGLPKNIESPSAPISPTPTLTPTVHRSLPATEFVPTPLPEPKPYLIKLVQGAGDGVDEIYRCMAVYAPFPQFILYEDGQLIFYEGGDLVEAFLPDTEIDTLLKQIETTGYFKTGDSFEEHYDLPKDVQYGEGGWGVSISVKGKGAYIEPELTQYLVKPIQDTLDIIQRYQPPKDARPYLPRKIELWAAPLDSGYFSTPEPSVEIDDWPSKFPPLSKFYIGLSESQTKDLIASGYFSNVPELRVFRQNSVSYGVLACPPWFGY